MIFCLLCPVVLLYLADTTAGFGIPVQRFETAMMALDVMEPVTNVYLDFDKTIIVDGHSEVVRNGYCQAVYPNCTGFDANDTMAMVNTIIDGKKIDNTSFSAINVTEEFITSFGGEARLANITNFLQFLRDNNVAVKILSTSWFPITETQWKNYLINVTSKFGLGFQEDEILTIADPGPGKSACKGCRIQKDLNLDATQFSGETMFADDSWGNIESARNVANTLWLKKRIGLEDQDIDYIKASLGPSRPFLPLQMAKDVFGAVTVIIG